MRKQQHTVSGLPDFWVTVSHEMKSAQGEDSFCRCFCENAGLIGVFDGCGGLGATRHREYEDKTEAYMASRICSGAFFDAFQALFSASDLVAADSFRALAAQNCKQILTSCVPQSGSAPRVLGNMVKTFPTTAAAALIQRLDKGYEIDAIWAGDSRVYLLNGEGLAQLTLDDSTVPDPMESIYEDGILRNILCADKAPKLQGNRVVVKEPFLVFAATDGCFGYFSTPMEFEGILLGTLEKARSIAEWEDGIGEEIRRVAGDDYTLVMAAYGFGSFDEVKKSAAQRLRYLCDTYLRYTAQLPLGERAPRQELWGRYAPNYLRYLEGR